MITIQILNDINVHGSDSNITLISEQIRQFVTINRK